MGEVSYLPLLEDMTWSYSRVEALNDCPYRFFLKYIYGCKEEPMFYASFGSWIHRLIERYYRGELSKEEMITEYLSGFAENVQGDRPKPEIVEKYIKSGADYLRSFVPFPYEMVDVEKKVEFTVGDLPFVGFIDFLGVRDGEYYIVDNKSRQLKPRSNRKKPTASDRELDRMLRQLYLYAAAVKQEYGRFPKALCFNCFRNGVFIEEPFRQEAYEEAVAWALTTVKLYKEPEDFVPSLDYFGCRYLCGVHGDCVYDQLNSKGR